MPELNTTDNGLDFLGKSNSSNYGSSSNKELDTYNKLVGLENLGNTCYMYV